MAKLIGSGVGFNISVDRGVPASDFGSFNASLGRSLKSSQATGDYLGTTETVRDTSGVQKSYLVNDSKGNLDSARAVVSKKVSDLEAKYMNSIAVDVQELNYKLYESTVTLYGDESKKALRKSLAKMGGEITNVEGNDITYRYAIPEDIYNKAKKQKKSAYKGFEKALLASPNALSDKFLERQASELMVEERIRLDKELAKYENKYTSKHKSYASLVKDKENLSQEELLERYKSIEKTDKAETKRKAERREKLGVAKMIIGSILVVADIARRILTSVLNNASKARSDASMAWSEGMTYKDVMLYNAYDKTFGLKEGTSGKAISDLQAKFGDITNLDEKALGTLARVMGGEVKQLVYSGIGGDEPDKLLESVLNKFFEQYKSGKNSLGQYVGQEQALRELTTVLRGVSPEIAMIFSTMAHEWKTGANAGTFSNYTEMKKKVQYNRGGLSDVELNALTSLGSTANLLNTTAKQLITLLQNKISLGLSKLIDKIADTRIGESAEQRIEHDRKNRELLRTSLAEDTEAYGRAKRIVSSKLGQGVYKNRGMNFLSTEDIEKYLDKPDDYGLNAEEKAKYDKVQSLKNLAQQDPALLGALTQLLVTSRRIKKSRAQIGSQYAVKYNASEHTAEGKAQTEAEEARRIFYDSSFVGGIASLKTRGGADVPKMKDLSRQNINMLEKGFALWSKDAPIAVDGKLTEGTLSNKAFMRVLAEALNEIKGENLIKVNIRGNPNEEGMKTLSNMYSSGKFSKLLKSAELLAFYKLYINKDKGALTAIEALEDEIYHEAELMSRVSYGKLKIGDYDKAVAEAQRLVTQDRNFLGGEVKERIVGKEGEAKVRMEIVITKDGKQKVIQAGQLDLSSGNLSNYEFTQEIDLDKGMQNQNG